MAWKYKDLVNAGRGDTIREITEEEMLYGLSPGYTAAERYSPYNPEDTAGRGDWGVGDNAFLNDQDWNAVQDYKKQYEDAKLLGDQAGMDAAHEAAQKVRYKYGYSGGADGSAYHTIVADTSGLDLDGDDGGFSAFGGSGYMSQYQSRIDALLNSILNREAFSYNKDEDPLYQQYKESYTRSGNRAMQDTLAQISARTGGLASSYAGSASQQSYNNYMAALADKVPELHQLAYSMYQDELANDRADLNMLLGMDDTYYGRYRDSVGDQQWQQQFDYNAYRDSVGDRQWQQSFDYNAGRDSLSDSQYGQKLAQSQIDAILQAGGSVSDELLRQSGYSGDYITAMKNYYQQQAAQAALKGSGSSGGKTGGTTTTMSLTTAKQAASKGVFSEEVLAVLRKNGYSDEMLTAIYGYEPGGSDAGGGDREVGLGDLNTASISALGLGPLSYDTVDSMVQQGVLTVYDAGSKLGVKWADGWSAEKYKNSKKTGSILSMLG